VEELISVKEMKAKKEEKKMWRKIEGTLNNEMWRLKRNEYNLQSDEEMNEINIWKNNRTWRKCSKEMKRRNDSWKEMKEERKWNENERKKNQRNKYGKKWNQIKCREINSMKKNNQWKEMKIEENHIVKEKNI